MSSQRRFAPIGVRFEPEQVAGLTGIYKMFLFHVYAYPLYVRLKNCYKSEPIIPSKMASVF